MRSDTTSDNCRENILKGIKKKESQESQERQVRVWVVNNIIVNEQVVVVRRHVD